LVFVRTKHGANRLAQQLTREGVHSDAIHGNKAQNARTRALKEFKDGRTRVLVATDIAARGLDIEALPHVVNYDLPHVAEDYVHRIGRTGRAGAEGEAVSFVSAEERPLMAAIERLMNRKVEQKAIAGFEPGTRSLHPAPAEPQRQRQQQRQRRPQQQQRQPQRHGQPQRQQPQRQAQPQRHRHAQASEYRRLPAPIAAEHEAQLREARARAAMDEPYEPQAQPRSEPRPEPRVSQRAPRRGFLLGGNK
jgi:ATP-dependent RNA helicase RhlE